MITRSNYQNGGSPVSAAIVGSLYALADDLERAWPGAELADDFGSRMVEAAVRCLSRAGIRRPDGRRRRPDEQALFAKRLLAKIWRINARRDAARHSAAKIAGKRIVEISLDDAREIALPGGAGWLDSDIPGGYTACSAARVLVAHGWPRVRACALVLFYATGESYDLTSDLLARRFAAPVNASTLRQWKRRHFTAGLALLSQADEIRGA